jgi:hypothetical protein
LKTQIDELFSIHYVGIKNRIPRAKILIYLYDGNATTSIILNLFKVTFEMYRFLDVAIITVNLDKDSDEIIKLITIYAYNSFKDILFGENVTKYNAIKAIQDITQFKNLVLDDV